MNKLYSLVDDIYKVVSEKTPADGVDLYDEIDRFGENLSLIHISSPRDS